MPRNRQSRPRNQLSLFDNHISLWDSDPFADMRRVHQMMLQPFGTGLFNNDDFFNDFGRVSRNFDKLDMGDMNTRGQYIMQSYSSKTVIGPDGRPVTEKTVKKETSTVDRDGRRIVERDNVYKHSGQNIKKVEKERRLGDQRIKVVKEIKNNERNEYRDLENMEEHEVEQFNSKFNKLSQESGHSRLNQVSYRGSDQQEGARVRMIKY